MFILLFGDIDLYVHGDRPFGVQILPPSPHHDGSHQVLSPVTQPSQTKLTRTFKLPFPISGRWGIVWSTSVTEHTKPSQLNNSSECICRVRRQTLSFFLERGGRHVTAQIARRRMWVTLVKAQSCGRPRSSILKNVSIMHLKSTIKKTW